MAENNPFETNCPIARVTQILGEGWTLLILREAFLGTTRFNDFERELGIARNILSVRLKKLVEAGILLRRPSREDGRAIEYRLSQAGQALLPVLVGLAQWSGEWLCDGCSAVRFVDRSSGEEIPYLSVTNRNGAPVRQQDILMIPAESADRAVRERYERAVNAETAVEVD